MVFTGLHMKFLVRHIPCKNPGSAVGPGFESRSPRIAQARVRLVTDALPQTPHRAGALYTGYALFLKNSKDELWFQMRWAQY